MSESRRKNFTGEFKAKVALEAIRGIKTVNEIGQELYIRRKLVCGSESCKSRHPACLMSSAAPNLPTRLPVRSVCIQRLADSKWNSTGSKKSLETACSRTQAMGWHQ